LSAAPALGQPRPVRLVATDLDGTVVRSDGTISTRTARALRSADEAGLVVVLVTGRPPRWMQQVAEMTGHSGVAICANGALVYDMHAEHLLSERLLQPATAKRVARRLQHAHPELVFAVEYRLTFGHEAGYRHGWSIGDVDVRVGSVDLLLDRPVAKLLARHPSLSLTDLITEAAPLLGTDATVTSSSTEALLEISAYGVTKASGLAELSATAGVTAEEVVAFGDMPNDLAMLAWAGHSVAVANAHPDVLAVADEVTAGNDEDGVALVLERLLAER
jgi:Cof subfamily protein (haloacid dehalogenase superfamily)